MNSTQYSTDTTEQYRIVQCNTEQYSAIQNSTVQYRANIGSIKLRCIYVSLYWAVQSSTEQYSIIQYSTVQIQYDTVWYSTVQYRTIKYITIQFPVPTLVSSVHRQICLYTLRQIRSSVKQILFRQPIGEDESSREKCCNFVYSDSTIKLMIWQCR